MMRIALLADIHGNLPALEAVSADLERQQPDHVVVNGDLINAVPFSAEVIDFVRQRHWLAVRGNHEYYYLDFGTERAVGNHRNEERWGQLHWLLGRISPQQGAYLATLPDERTFYLPGTQPLRIAHGVPGRNRVGFYNQQPAEQIAAEIEGVAERTLVSAHTHVQVDRQITRDDDLTTRLESDPHVDMHASAAALRRRHWHLVNPGSVGLPLNGDPRAQYALLTSVPDHVERGGWQVTHVRVAYDRRPALAAFAASGMLARGGVISQLFYWELATAEPEIVRFHRWAYENGRDPDIDGLPATFATYRAATGRHDYVVRLDPLQRREG